MKIAWFFVCLFLLAGCSSGTGQPETVEPAPADVTCDAPEGTDGQKLHCAP